MSYNWATDVVDAQAASQPNVSALKFAFAETEETVSVSYAELSERSSQAAHFLSDSGVKFGDIVMIILPKIPAWWYIMTALNKLGAIAAPCAVSLTSKDIAHRCNSTRIGTIIALNEHLPKVEEALSEDVGRHHRLYISVDDPRNRADGEFAKNAGFRWIAFSSFATKLNTYVVQPEARNERNRMLLYFTSGTTGYPKMVVHRQSYARDSVLTARHWQDLKPTDLFFSVIDTGWAKSAWSAIYGQFAIGCTVFVFDYRGKFDAAATLRLMSRHRITVFCAPPTAYRMLILQDLKNFDLRSLRHCVSAGEPLNPEINEAWQRGVGRTIREGYGQTETICFIATLPGDVVKVGSMGKPLPYYDTHIIDDECREVDVGIEGHVAIRIHPNHPGSLFERYEGKNTEEANAFAFQNGWYLTGDRAYKDRTGYYFFVGRADDVIKSSGYRIGPFEIESALLEHPVVAESAVVGVPDAIRGQSVKAFVLLKPGIKGSEQLKNELLVHCGKVLAPFKIPKYIDFVNELPKTISGKIRRVELRNAELIKSKL